MRARCPDHRPGHAPLRLLLVVRLVLGRLVLALVLAGWLAVVTGQPTPVARAVDHVFVVTTTADNGNDLAPTPGSLRQAILLANATPNVDGPDLVNFNIAGAGVQTIVPTATL